MTPEEVKRFQDDLDAQGEQKVRVRLAGGAWTEARAECVREWLDRRQQARDEVLRGREVAAGERSASATERAATAAETSARWAKAAVLVSLFALAVAAWAAWKAK